MTRWLDKEIAQYAAGGAYPFHMPGSKRQSMGLGDPYRYDITEIDGFDDLRNASGLLAELEQEWARLYGAERAFLSVNGSTGSNLAVIFAATAQHDAVLIAEGCHWSVKNAAELRELSVTTLPAARSREGFCEAVQPEDVKNALEAEPAIRTVIITSPTYEGIVSDVGAIAEIAHEHGASLIVDAAHGAHLGLDSAFFPNPISQGADAVIVSLHKTLPVLGQVSLILLPATDGSCLAGEGKMAGSQRLTSARNGKAENSDLPHDQWRIQPAEVKRYLNMFQTSSPSYVLMSSAAAGCRFLQEQGERAFREYEDELCRFYRETDDLKNLAVIRRDDQDRSKIVIAIPQADEAQKNQKISRDNNGNDRSDSNTRSDNNDGNKSIAFTGYDLMERLRRDYALELEKASAHYAIAMTSLMDTREGFDRLSAALHELDRELEGTVSKQLYRSLL